MINFSSRDANDLVQDFYRWGYRAPSIHSGWHVCHTFGHDNVNVFVFTRQRPDWYSQTYALAVGHGNNVKVFDLSFEGYFDFCKAFSIGKDTFINKGNQWLARFLNGNEERIAA
jgi:hypothetical protein